MKPTDVSYSGIPKHAFRRCNDQWREAFSMDPLPNLPPDHMIEESRLWRIFSDGIKVGLGIAEHLGRLDWRDAAKEKPEIKRDVLTWWPLATSEKIYVMHWTGEHWCTHDHGITQSAPEKWTYIKDPE
jgi:hypothetical protein